MSLHEGSDDERHLVDDAVAWFAAHGEQLAPAVARLRLALEPWPAGLEDFAAWHEGAHGERLATPAAALRRWAQFCARGERGERRIWARMDWDQALAGLGANLRTGGCCERHAGARVAALVEVLGRSPEEVRARLLPLVAAVPGAPDQPGYAAAIGALADAAEAVGDSYLERRMIPAPKAGRSKRRAQRRAEQFGPQAEYCRGRPCCACGQAPPSNPHHVRSRGAGGTDADAVPLCELCHRDVHAHGASWLELSRGISLADTAREFALRVSGGGA